MYQSENFLTNRTNWYCSCRYTFSIRKSSHVNFSLFPRRCPTSKLLSVSIHFGFVDINNWLKPMPLNIYQTYKRFGIIVSIDYTECYYSKQICKVKKRELSLLNNLWWLQYCCWRWRFWKGECLTKKRDCKPICLNRNSDVNTFIIRIIRLQQTEYMRK